jgi:hypothetical protein
VGSVAEIVIRNAAAFTKAVVASCVVSVPAVAVGPDGTPVNVGPANVATPFGVILSDRFAIIHLKVL